MAASFTLYSSARQFILDGTIDLLVDTLKVMLVTSSYTPDLAHDEIADITSSPTNEVSSGSGYTTGGETLTGKTITHTDSPSVGTFDAENVVWTSLTKVFRYGVLYASKSISPYVNPLIGYILFDATPADIDLTASNFTIQWNASGIITD